MSLATVLAGFKTAASALGLSEQAYLQHVVTQAIVTGTMTDINAILAAATGPDVARVQSYIDAVTLTRGVLLKATKSTAIVTTDLVAESTTDAAVQGIGYVQADVQTIATLANSLKAKLNLVTILVNELKAKANTMNA